MKSSHHCISTLLDGDVYCSAIEANKSTLTINAGLSRGLCNLRIGLRRRQTIIINNISNIHNRYRRRRSSRHHHCCPLAARPPPVRIFAHDFHSAALDTSSKTRLLFLNMSDSFWIPASIKRPCFMHSQLQQQQPPPKVCRAIESV
jgi:hypothetical protein